MPVPVDELDLIAATTAELYREAETALARLIAKHLAGDLSSDMSAPAWVEAKLTAVGDLRKAAQAIIAGLQAASEGAFKDAAAEAFRAGWASALAELPKAWFPESGIGQAAAQAADEVPGFGAMEALAAAVHRDVGTKSQNILRDVLDAFRSVVTAATSPILTGALTRRQAAQSAWRKLTDKGITSFTDKSGRRWQLASYVEMATRTVAQRAAVTGQTDRLDALGVDLVSVSNAPQECERCRPFEGRVLRLGTGPIGRISVEHGTQDGKTVAVFVKATLDQARAAGFQHPNCRHSVSAYLPGVSTLPAQPTADPDGDKARQQQRALEREIRANKLAEAAALDEEGRKDAGRKVRASQAKLRDHLAAHPDLKRLPYRERIGAGNIGPKGTGPAGEIGPNPQLDIDGNPVVPKPKPQPSGAAAEPTPDVAGQLSTADIKPEKPKPVPPAPVEPPKPKGVLAGDFTGLQRVGPQGGSNPGGLYVDGNGVRWYVKAQKSEQHARNEVASSALYKAAGVDAPDVHLGQGTPDLPGGWHTASRVIDGKRVDDPATVAAELRKGFGVDAWLANWDVVGATFDNVVKDGRKVSRIDLGGSLLYRAQGGPKGSAFGKTVDEWLSLRDPGRAPQAAKVFNGMTPAEQLAAVNRVNRVKVSTIREIVAEAGLPKDVADTLIARRKDLASRLPTLREQAKRHKAWLQAHKGSAQGRDGLTTPPLQLTYATAELLPKPVHWTVTKLHRVTDAVVDYRGSGYTRINNSLRKGKTSEQSTVDSIDEAMALSALPRTVGVHRGIRDPAQVFGAAWNDVDITGLEWTEAGYSSTTVDERVAKNFASSGGDKLLMRLVLPKGTQAVRLSDMAGPKEHLSGIRTEAEVLVSRTKRYRVVADYGNDQSGTRRVDVEVITT